MCITEKLGPSPTFLPTVYTDKISGVNANFLRKSLENNGLGDIEKSKEKAEVNLGVAYNRYDVGGLFQTQC